MLYWSIIWLFLALFGQKWGLCVLEVSWPLFAFYQIKLFQFPNHNSLLEFGVSSLLVVYTL